MYTAQLSLFTLVLLVLEMLLITVQGAPVETLWNSRYRNSNKNKKTAIAYQRYVRRRPSYYPDDLYMDEYVEVFHTQLRPPAYWISDEEIDQIIQCDFNPSLEECKQFQEPTTTTTPRPPTYQLTDEEVERIIRCDFNPNLEECKQFKESNKSSTVRPSMKPPTAKTTTEWTYFPKDTTPKTTTPYTVTTTKRYIEDRTTEGLPALPNIPKKEVDEITTTTVETITTTTEDLPFLPNISEEEVEESPNIEYEMVTKQNVEKNGKVEPDGEDEGNNNGDYDRDDEEKYEQF